MSYKNVYCGHGMKTNTQDKCTLYFYRNDDYIATKILQNRYKSRICLQKAQFIQCEHIEKINAKQKIPRIHHIEKLTQLN